MPEMKKEMISHSKYKNLSQIVGLFFHVLFSVAYFTNMIVLSWGGGGTWGRICTWGENMQILHISISFPLLTDFSHMKTYFILKQPWQLIAAMFYH